MSHSHRPDLVIRSTSPPFSLATRCGTFGGMTLLEIASVLFVIGLLAVLLIPRFAGARATAQKTECLANLKRLGAALNSYLFDHEGWMPVATSSETEMWRKDREVALFMMEILRPYLLEDTERSFLCPADNRHPLVRKGVSYRWNRVINGLHMPSQDFHGLARSASGVKVFDDMEPFHDLSPLKTNTLYAEGWGAEGLNLSINPR